MSEPEFQECTVIALRGHQLWAEGDHGHIVRAWRPDEPGVRHGARIRVYWEEDGEINGWHDPESGQAVDQRHFDGRAEALAWPLACLNGCGVAWQAPSGAALLEAQHRCLHCGGALKTA
jgi:hypothetical protein